MTGAVTETNVCATVHCGNPAKLKCPTCIKLKLAETYFCSQVLYLCVDTSLRIISPFMPFITEELWQRLPKRANVKAPSICVADYPEPKQYTFRNEKLEGQANTAMDIARRVRSLRSDYELTNKQKADLFVELIGVDKSELTAMIGTLAAANQVTLVSPAQKAQIPAGCAKVTVSAKCAVSIALQGIIDVTKEVLKLNAKRDKLAQQVQKLEELTLKPDYEEKVPLGVRTNNAEKMQSLSTEMKHLDEAVQALSASN